MLSTLSTHFVERYVRNVGKPISKDDVIMPLACESGSGGGRRDANNKLYDAGLSLIIAKLAQACDVLLAGKDRFLCSSQ